MPGTLGTSFDRVAHCYDETRAIPPSVRDAVVAGIRAALDGSSAAPALLEVGVGTGRIAVPLADAGVRVVGIDIAPAMLARLHERRPDIPVLRADAKQPPFRPATFDAVLFVHVLHVVADAAATLRAARGVLRPGGVLLCGSEEFVGGRTDELWKTLRTLVADLGGVRLEERSPSERAGAAFAAEVRAAGVEPVTTVLARWQEPMSAREVLERISGKVWSCTWDIPDAIMPELIERLTPVVEAVVGDLDRQIEREATFTLTAARVPAG